MTAPATAAEPTTRARLRRARWPVALAALVLLVLGLLAWAGGSRGTGYLDPAAVDPGGSRALARVLAGQGVSVVRAETAQDAAAALAAAPRATLLVTAPTRISTRMAAALTTTPAHVVVVDGLPEVAGPWPTSLPAGTGRAVAEREPDCSWPVAVRAGSATTGGGGYEPAAGFRCYDGTVVHLPAGVPGAASGTDVTVIGAGEPFTNAALAEAGNAALALGVLGQDPVLVWWLPSYADPLYPSGGAAPALTDLVPPWVPWVAAQLAIGVLVLAYARGRRFGPVVTEPLPVVVRAAETTEGLGRLYRRARDREHAAGQLAAAATARLVAVLGLPPGSDAAAVARVVATRTGRSAADVLTLLDRPAPADDVALVRLAQDLDALERQVRQP